MKKLIAMTLVLALTLTCFLTGCTKVEKNIDEVKKEKVVRTNIAAEPDNLHPWKSAAADTNAIFLNVFEGLLSFNEKGELIPCLAKERKISEDGLTYTFSLRNDVTFHNGKKMTSADVLYSYNALTGLGGEEALTKKFQSVTSIEATDDFTFVMKLKESSSSFLGLNKVAILPCDYNEQETKPVGTGPFTFEEYIPGQKIVLNKNKAYYDKEKMPKIDRAEIYVMTDFGAVVSAVQSGQLDLASVTPDDAKVLKDKIDIYTSPQNMVQLFAFNNEVAPFDNEDVRKAINYAVNKKEIIDGAFGGYATELFSNFSPVMQEYYNNELSNVYSFDIEKAKELLKKAGYENGFDMTITVPGNYQQHVDSAQILVEQLKKIGINADVEIIEWATWLDKVYSKAEYQSTVVAFGGKLDPNDILIRYTTDYKKNFIKFSDKKYDELVNSAAVELDVEKRAAQYKEAQKILTEKSASVYICDPNLTVASRKDLKGYTFYPINFIDFSKLYFE
ncbi:MAG: ABC transporter substrate-binding protein [Oscillospiraceae bacterium]